MESTDKAADFGLNVEADESASEESVLAWSFLLDGSKEVRFKGTGVTGTVLACALTEGAVVGLFTLEPAPTFPPPHGEDWLVGMALPD